MKKGSRTSGGATVHVKSKNFPLTDALHDQVVHKMSRLDKYLDRLNNIDVELCTESTRNAADHNHVEATAHVAGGLVRVTSSDSDMYAAIDEAVDKLYRQLNRKKERMKAHHGSKFREALSGDTVEPEYDDEPARDGGREIIRIKQFEMKPQFEEEAIDEMESLGHGFYMFLNAHSEQINVVYRRNDGTYGIIQPVR